MNNQVVYYHEGYDSYVPIILKNNSTYIDSESHIILTDITYNGISCHRIGDYSHGEYLQEFNKYYKKLSDTLDSYNYSIYKRWYVIYEYMKLNSIDSIWYLDSDVLLFQDIRVLNRSIGDHESALLSPEKYGNYKSMIQYYDSVLNNSAIQSVSVTSGHTSFFTLNGLENLLLRGISMYRDHLKLCAKYYDKIFKNGGNRGGVDDMHLVTDYYLSFNDNIYDLRSNDLYVDDNIKKTKYEDGEYKSVYIHGLKQKYMINNKLIKDDTEIDLVTLHFQHTSKYTLHKYINYKLSIIKYLEISSIRIFRSVKSLISRKKNYLINCINNI